MVFDLHLTFPQKKFGQIRDELQTRDIALFSGLKVQEHLSKYLMELFFHVLVW